MDLAIEWSVDTAAFSSTPFQGLGRLIKRSIKRGFPGGPDGKESACNAGNQGSVPGLGDLLEKSMATQSSILAWRIPWTEELTKSQAGLSEYSFTLRWKLYYIYNIILWGRSQYNRGNNKVKKKKKRNLKGEERTLEPVPERMWVGLGQELWRGVSILREGHVLTSLEGP